MGESFYREVTTMAHRIVVVGAGYAGLAAAQRLARRTRKRDVEVELVNASGSFVERVRLHQVIAGIGQAERPLAGILAGTGVRLSIGTVSALDVAGRDVVLDDGRRIGYDTLVYALGSRTNRRGVPGADRFAYTLDSVARTPVNQATATDNLGRSEPDLGRSEPDLGRSRSDVGRSEFDGRRSEFDVGLTEFENCQPKDVVALTTALRSARTLVVCGGGLTGVEAAAELAEAYPGLAVTLATRGEIGYSVSDRGRDHIRRVLGRLGVQVLEHAAVTEITPTAVRLGGGWTLAADAALWCGSFAVPDIAADAGLATDDAGRVLVDGTMRSVSHPNVYAVGDAAAVPMPWGTPRMSCQAGLPAGLYVAGAIAARLGGREPAPYRFRFAEQCISLGRNDGLIQPVRADDGPHRTVLTGRSAAVVKEYVCRAAAWAARTGRPSSRLLYASSVAGSGSEWSTTRRETARVSTT
jgi:NADH:quinone reductase (non-electrogenic)